MGIDPFAATKLLIGTNTKLSMGAGAAATTELNAKLPNNTSAKLPKQGLSAAEQLRRLEEAMAFLRQHLSAGPQPARVLLKAASTLGIAERTLHRAKDLLGVTTERSGGYAARGQWVWYPPASNSGSRSRAAHEKAAVVSRSL